MTSLLDEPTIGLSVLALVANLVILAALYLLLPKTSRTGQLRFVMRFVLIWNFADLGSRWMFDVYHTVLHSVFGVILIIGMSTVAAMWPHLAWLTVLNDRERREKERVRLENYQLVPYVMVIVFLIWGFFARDEGDIMPYPHMLVLQGWFLACLLWSVSRFLRPVTDPDGIPALEKRSRLMLSIASAIMFFFVLNDLILGLMFGEGLTAAILFSPISAVILSYGYFLKGRFLVGPVPEKKGEEKEKKPKKKKQKEKEEEGTEEEEGAERPKKKKGPRSKFLMRPGKTYVDLSGSRRVGAEVMIDQLGMGRLGFVITDRPPDKFRKEAKLKMIPVKRYSFGKEARKALGELDLSSDEEMEMVPFMVKEFAFEASIIKDSEGSVVLLEGVDTLFRICGPKLAKGLLKDLRKVVRGCDELRFVVTGSTRKMGKKRARWIEKLGFGIKID
jgi:hypothetical protein